MTGLAETLAEWLARGDAVALVTVADTRGSTPREAGAAMLVARARTSGTVGGGRLEWLAVEHARALLDSDRNADRLEVPLGPAIGQCCGGHVTLTVERADAQTQGALAARERRAADARPVLLLFGAGHVGKALAAALSSLPLRLRWIDARAGEFPDRVPPGVEMVVSDRPLDHLAAAPAGAGYLVLTHSHALDFDLTEAALRRGDAAYVGLIGSATKRGRFERWCAARGRDATTLAGLTCPIGAPLTGDKRPEVIAALVAAEILVAFAAQAAKTA